MGPERGGGPGGVEDLLCLHLRQPRGRGHVQEGHQAGDEAA